MSKRQALGRHRATPVRTNPLESISKAVASNAGSVGRQAAVIAAASGLVLTLGVPAQATPTVREAAAVPAGALSAETLSAERVAVKAVTVPAKTEAKFEVKRAEITSKPAPEPEPVVVAVSNTVQSQSGEARYAATTRANVNSGASAAATTRSTAASTTTSSTATTAAAAPAKAEAAASAPSAGLTGIAATARQYLGAPYVWGGSTPSGWDCSGFIKYVYAQHGINIARGTSAILGSGQFVRTSNPKPGDLVFQNGGGHAGIYLGNGQIIGAQNPSVGTVLRPANSPYGPLYGYYTLRG
ncbi:NlpC/P60 family protein [Zafaria sp. Z1313]|uniref:C40 family peptidase n=1 Tax=unclassified Zafaria TaxID=2828765 RepID=UPI002E7A3427|nr:NlpC/P60 family protein [Zafaria sp. J156]MEE1622256.1 NlpC/P60 family protein [Zafaria sp. J156]